MIQKFVLGILILITLWCIALSVQVALLGVLVEKPPEHYNLSIRGNPPELRFFAIGGDNVNKFTGIDFYEIEKSNLPGWLPGTERKMWSIYPSSHTPHGTTVSRIEYGQIPGGWIERAPAKHLSMENAHRLSFLTALGEFNVTLEGRNDWKTSGIRTQK